VAAAGAAAAGAERARPTILLVRLDGHQRNSVFQERTRTSEVGCSVTTRTHQVQMLRFVSRRRETIAGPSLGVGSARLPLDVSVTGWRERRVTVARGRPGCDAESTVTTTRCGPVTVTGRAHVRMPALGHVEIGGSLASRGRSPCETRLAPPFAFLLGAKSTFDPRFLLGPTAHGGGGGAGVVRTRVETQPPGIRRVATVTWGLGMRRSG
jgi:hypothetical protein